SLSGAAKNSVCLIVGRCGIHGLPRTVSWNSSRNSDATGRSLEWVSSAVRIARIFRPGLSGSMCGGWCCSSVSLSFATCRRRLVADICSQCLQLFADLFNLLCQVQGLDPLRRVLQNQRGRAVHLGDVATVKVLL